MAANKPLFPKSALTVVLTLFALVSLLGVVIYISSHKNTPPVTVSPKIEPTIMATVTPTPESIIESTFTLIKNISELNKEIKKSCSLNVLYERSVQGRTHVVFNDKDLGEGLVYDLSGNKPLYSDKDKNIIYDGKNYGQGGSVAIDGNNIAFVRYAYDENKSWQPHIIYNGENIGAGDSPKLDSGHLVFIRGGHIIYNGKDLGEGEMPQIKGDNIVYLVNSGYYDKSQVIYNGKDLGNIWGSGSLHIYNDGVFFSQRNNKSIWYNGKDIKEISGLIRNIEGNNVLFEKIVTGADGGNYVFLNDKKMGDGGNAQLRNGHIAWEDGSDVYFDGLYVGKGQNVRIDGQNIVYEGDKNGHYNLIFNGNDLGESVSALFTVLIEDNIVYSKIDGDLYCNSVNLGKYTCDKAHEHGDCLFATLKE